MIKIKTIVAIPDDTGQHINMERIENWEALPPIGSLYKIPVLNVALKIAEYVVIGYTDTSATSTRLEVRLIRDHTYSNNSIFTVEAFKSLGWTRYH